MDLDMIIYKMEIGKMKISEVMPHLNDVALIYGLKLNRVSEFKLARKLLANLYYREVC